MKKINTFFLFPLLAISMFACNDYSDILITFESRFSEDNDNTKYLSDFAADNFRYRFEKEIDNNWCMVEEKNKNLVVTVQANLSEKERIANIIFEHIYGGLQYTVTVKQKAFYWSKEEQQIIDAINIVEKVYPNSVSIQLDTVEYGFNSYSIDNFSGVFIYRSPFYNYDLRVFFNLIGSAVSLSGGAKGVIYTANDDGFERGYFHIWIGDYILLTNGKNIL